MGNSAKLYLKKIIANEELLSFAANAYGVVEARSKRNIVTMDRIAMNSPDHAITIVGDNDNHILFGGD